MPEDYERVWKFNVENPRMLYLEFNGHSGSSLVDQNTKGNVDSGDLVHEASEGNKDSNGNCYS